MSDNVIPFPNKQEKEEEKLPSSIDWSLSYDEFMDFSFSLDDSPKIDFSNLEDTLSALGFYPEVEAVITRIQMDLRDNPDMVPFVLAQLRSIEKNLKNIPKNS